MNSAEVRWPNSLWAAATPAGPDLPELIGTEQADVIVIGAGFTGLSTALHLRFDIAASSLPDDVKLRLIAHRDQRITAEGVIIIKAQRYRSQDKNRADALARLQDLVDDAAAVPRPRKPTKPTRSSQRRRVDSKVKRGQTKAARGRIDE